jgi:hypothetical protein
VGSIVELGGPLKQASLCQKSRRAGQVLAGEGARATLSRQSGCLARVLTRGSVLVFANTAVFNYADILIERQVCQSIYLLARSGPVNLKFIPCAQRLAQNASRETAHSSFTVRGMAASSNKIDFLGQQCGPSGYLVKRKV